MVSPRDVPLVCHLTCCLLHLDAPFSALAHEALEVLECGVGVARVILAQCLIRRRPEEGEAHRKQR